MLALIERLKSKIEGEDKIHLRLFVILIFSLLTNILGCAFGYSTAHRMLPWIATIGFVLPVINFTISLLFLEAKTLKERLYIMLINSFALSVGGSLISVYFG
jgi:hypothetical protein